jgi:DNA-3-methyladenine glycosylase
MTAIPSLSSNNRLPRRFYAQPPAEVAKGLLGQSLLRLSDSGEILGGKIVETEAYLSAEDPASHSFTGLRRRNQAMFAKPGTLYVYSIHAKYCMNVSTERVGIGSAVLIRAIEPLWGLEDMRRARGQTDPRKLTGGPGMLCQALGITTADDGIDLIESDRVAIVYGEAVPTAEIAVGPRIGISRAQDLPLRFLISGTRYASR